MKTDLSHEISRIESLSDTHANAEYQLRISNTGFSSLISGDAAREALKELTIKESGLKVSGSGGIIVLNGIDSLGLPEVD